MFAVVVCETFINIWLIENLFKQFYRFRNICLTIKIEKRLILENSRVLFQCGFSKY